MIRYNNLGRLTPQQLGFQLVEAINRSTPMEEIRALIEYGADVNIQDNNGQTPLYHACDKNNADLATLLLNHGANVDIKDHFGRTPLHRTCYDNNLRITAFLIEHGADVNIQNVRGGTPLYAACRHNNAELVTLLLREDTQVNIRSNYGNAPLSLACFMNNHEIIPLLLNAGAEVDLSLLKAFVRYDERRQIDDIINNQTFEHLNLHLIEDANRDTIAILDMLYFPSRYDGILHLIGNDNNEIHLHFHAGAEYLLK